jgi:hypothetical protein
MRSVTITDALSDHMYSLHTLILVAYGAFAAGALAGAVGMIMLTRWLMRGHDREVT